MIKKEESLTKGKNRRKKNERSEIMKPIFLNNCFNRKFLYQPTLAVRLMDAEYFFIEGNRQY